MAGERREGREKGWGKTSPHSHSPPPRKKIGYGLGLSETYCVDNLR